MKTAVLCTMLVFLSYSISLASPQVTAVYWSVEGGYRLGFSVRAGQYKVYSWDVLRTDPFDLAAPEGWYARVFTRNTYWSALSVDDYLQPGQTLLGCAATFPELPQQIDYSVRQSRGSDYYGTLVPTPIPEPSSLLALAGGLAGLAGLLMRQRSG